MTASTAGKAPDLGWVPGDTTRIPYAAYQREDVFERERDTVWHGPVWNYLGLEADVPERGDWRTTFVGMTPVVLARDLQGELRAFENRCAHRGALICLERSGNAKTLQCVYHAWGYELDGTLRSVAFERGLQGKGGMPREFCKEDHGPRKLRVARFCGLVFGTFSPEAPALEDYLGPEIRTRIARVLGRPVEVIGRFTQALPNNWKLYFENVKDSYHASLLHLFFTTFRLNRLSQKGGIIVDESGGHHVSYSMIDRAAQTAGGEYREQGIRSEQSGYALADPSLLAGFDEWPDGVTLQILSVFPGFVLQQIQNCLAIRQVLPEGVGRTALHWTYLGRRDDTPEQRTVRLKQCNLVGAAGFVSMEDGAVGGFVQRGIAGAGPLSAVVQMGGSSSASDSSRVTEASVRGFWKAWRTCTGI